MLALCLSGAAFAQTAQSSCTPYKIPIQATVTQCGPGLVGSKFRTMTKTCPSGEVVESNDYDTSSCAAAPTGAGGVMTQETRCRLIPGACTGAPIAASCPAGQKWSLMGTGVAHCVDEDPVCPWGTSLTHDKNGNPSCAQNTCPSNQVLQADGKSCGCTGGTSWNGASCVPPSCYESTATTSTEACASGGTKYYRETTSCPGGIYGAPVKSGAWDESACQVTCREGPKAQTVLCTGARDGIMTRSNNVSCPNGPYGYETISWGTWDESRCVARCTPREETLATTCGDNGIGTKWITIHYTCGNGSYATENPSGCSCANGANDFPTCTPPAPPSTKCPPKYMWCTEERGQSDDPRDIYYQVWVRYYTGQSCTEEGGLYVQRDFYQGCPSDAEYKSYGAETWESGGQWDKS